MSLLGLHSDSAAVLAAIGKSQAIIEVNPDGTILTANQNFLATQGYRLEEIRGKHHQMFCDPAYVRSDDYREQSLGLKEINEAVISMDHGTQQNAAMVEESTAASHSLANEAEGLARLLSTFRTGDRQVRVPSRAIPAPATAKASPARQIQKRLAQGLGGNSAAETWAEF